jgi:hypothetical protein
LAFAVAADPDKARVFPCEDPAPPQLNWSRACQNAVCALPTGEQYREDFEWLLKEIVEGGSEAMI